MRNVKVAALALCAFLAGGVSTAAVLGRPEVSECPAGQVMARSITLGTEEHGEAECQPEDAVVYPGDPE